MCAPEEEGRGGGRAARRGAPPVVLYTREGCHLCEQARLGLVGICGELGVGPPAEVDIESDERLHARLCERIPVVEVEGTIVSELVLDPEAVRAALASRRPKLDSLPP